MFEYNDLSDDVNMSIYPQNSDQIRIHHLNEYNWKRNSNNDSSSFFENNLFEITYNGSSPKLTSSYEQVIIKVSSLICTKYLSLRKLCSGCCIDYCIWGLCMAYVHFISLWGYEPLLVIIICHNFVYQPRLK